MNVKILRHYFRYCKRHKVDPSFTGLKDFNKLARGLYIPK